MEEHSDCLFCKIVTKVIAAEIVYEDGSALAFLDIQPKAPGHAMVIPKRHAETIFDLGDEDVATLFIAVKKTAKMISSALSAEGLNIGINHRAAGGQVVSHLHVHILPRFSGDGGSSVHGIVNNPPKESLKEIGEKIRSVNFRN